MDDAREGRVFHGPRDYLDLARSPDATVDELRDLARSPYVFVARAVAEHPRTPLDVLSSLVPDEPKTWNDYALMVALAQHPNAEESLLRAIGSRLSLRSLREDRNPQGLFAAAIALFEQPRTPDDVLLTMVTSEEATTEFRKVAARQTTHAAIIEKLLADRSETVRRAASRRAQPRKA